MSHVVYVVAAVEECFRGAVEWSWSASGSMLVASVPLPVRVSKREHHYIREFALANERK